MTRLSFVLFAICVALHLQAQTTEQSSTPAKKVGRPDLPGLFLIDYGLNGTQYAPPNFTLQTWGSQTVDIYYMYDMRIGHSKFTVSPGIGFSSHHYKFSNGYTLDLPDPGTDNPVELVEAPSGIKKSQFITNYVDVPLEFRFTALPDDPARSFRVGLGFKGGVLINSFTKLKVISSNKTEKFKTAGDYHVNPFRYGPYLRLYIGNFNFFASAYISPLFKSGNPKGTTKDMTVATVGISVVGF